MSRINKENDEAEAIAEELENRAMRRRIRDLASCTMCDNGEREADPDCPECLGNGYLYMT